MTFNIKLINKNSTFIKTKISLSQNVFNKTITRSNKRSDCSITQF